MWFFNKKKAKKKPKFTKIFYATDVHGSEPTFGKFVNAANFYDVDVIILGGDITGKLMIPIIKEDGTYRATIMDVQHTAKNEQELKSITKLIEHLGCYHAHMSADEFARLKENPADVDLLFKQKAHERLTKWLKKADAKFQGGPAKCYITGGNDDDEQDIEIIKANQTDKIIFPEGRVVMIDDIHSMVSFGYSNPTPWDTPRELSEDKLAAMIEDVVKDIDDFSNVIFNFHCPPKDCTLDLAPKLDTSFDPPRPVTTAGEAVMVGVGSSAVRDAIEKYQPLLMLTGHIHESRGVVKIGRTTIVNPGSEYGEGILKGTIINIQDNNVLSYQMTSG
ncbi:MAG: metallophosphoesterase [Deltaproteobacteria bacterium]|nr:metallophosphoesterase [Deltaproteobacteria bacterium]